MGMSEKACEGATSGRTSNGKKPPHKCYSCSKEYTRPHKRLEHMRDCCPEKLEKCPTCGTGYTNGQGVKVHHSREHNESLSKVDIYCERCGDFYKRVFESAKDSFSHCDDCRPKAKSERVAGENNPMYVEDKPTITCENCGETVTVDPRNSDRRFCDYECRDEFQIGENHPAWNGGKEHYYGSHWPKLRQECLERDNYTCQGCGREESATTISLNAHHIIPRKDFDNPKEGDYLDNLVALCLSCHNKWEGVYLKPMLVG